VNGLKIDVSNAAFLPAACEAVLKSAGDKKIFVVNGPMGAGKTTLIKEFCKALNSKDSFSSPTYSIVNEYSYPGGKIFHFDLYRIEKPEQLLDIGMEEYLDSGQYCFIEWPSLALPLIPGSYVELTISPDEQDRWLSAKTVNK